MARGKFITFEGGEGAGKSTQLRALVARLKEAGVACVATREPGGSDGAEAIRKLILEGAADRWSPISETLLMYAARRDHIERTIRPNLDAGTWVVCDRFADSTRAYQGVAGGADPGLIRTLEAHVVAEVKPDLTIIIDLPVDAGLARALGRGGTETRFESKGEAFHERLRQAFLDIAIAEPERCEVIDGAASIGEVEDAIWTAVQSRLLGDG